MKAAFTEVYTLPARSMFMDMNFPHETSGVMDGVIRGQAVADSMLECAAIIARQHLSANAIPIARALSQRGREQRSMDRRIALFAARDCAEKFVWTGSFHPETANIALHSSHDESDVNLTGSSNVKSDVSIRMAEADVSCIGVKPVEY